MHSTSSQNLLDLASDRRRRPPLSSERGPVAAIRKIVCHIAPTSWVYSMPLHIAVTARRRVSAVFVSPCGGFCLCAFGGVRRSARDVWRCRAVGRGTPLTVPPAGRHAGRTHAWGAWWRLWSAVAVLTRAEQPPRSITAVPLHTGPRRGCPASPVSRWPTAGPGVKRSGARENDPYGGRCRTPNAGARAGDRRPAARQVRGLGAHGRRRRPCPGNGRRRPPAGGEAPSGRGRARRPCAPVCGGGKSRRCGVSPRRDAIRRCPPSDPKRWSECCRPRSLTPLARQPSRHLLPLVLPDRRRGDRAAGGSIIDTPRTIKPRQGRSSPTAGVRESSVSECRARRTARSAHKSGRHAPPAHR